MITSALSSGSSPPWFATWGNFAEITSAQPTFSIKPIARQRWKKATVKTAAVSSFAGLVANARSDDLMGNDKTVFSSNYAGFVTNPKKGVSAQDSVDRKSKKMSKDSLLSSSSLFQSLDSNKEDDEEFEADDAEEMMTEDDEENEQLL